MRTTAMMSIFLWVGLAHAQMAQLKMDHLKSQASIGQDDIKRLSQNVLELTDRHGRVTPSLQVALFEFEDTYRGRFDQKATGAYQSLVAKIGAQMHGPIDVPLENTPYWLKDAGPLVKFRSTPKLPPKADYVVIGAGLTGASAATNLTTEAQAGKTVVVLEMGDRPAAGASGRNGGNIEMIKENFLEDYHGFVQVQRDLIKNRFPQLSEKELNDQAIRQSKYLLNFFQANVREIQKTIQEDGLQVDASLNGWLRIADSADEEKGLADEINFAKSLGLNFEIWPPEKIKEKTGISAKYAGRYIKESGNYHPYKYVNESLKSSIKKGVKFYTETKVTQLERQADGSYIIRAGKNAIHAKKVIIATNAYTRDLLPDLDLVIEPRVSHVADFTHTLDTFNGMTVTMKKGDWYANFPQQDRYVDPQGVQRGTLHVGGGLDTPIPRNTIHNPPFIKSIYQDSRKETAMAVPDTKNRPPERAWSGVMAFTEDRAPILSFYYRDGAIDRSLVLAVAFNGYGGSQSAISGKLAAQMAMTGKVPQELPDDLFSIHRFHTKVPLFEQSENCYELIGAFLKRP